jgi:hypothetical protein
MYVLKHYLVANASHQARHVFNFQFPLILMLHRPWSTLAHFLATIIKANLGTNSKYIPIPTLIHIRIVGVTIRCWFKLFDT